MDNNSRFTSIKLDTNQQIYFISDAHAGSADKEAEYLKDQYLTSFFNMLMEISPPPILYIVGDLFDFWFEYRHTIPTRYQKILGQLTLMIEQGIEIRYITGNHDFWMNSYFPQEMKIPVYHGVHAIQVGSQKIHIFHGDGILSEDIGYRILKKILRNKWVIAAYKLIHPDLGIPIARWASATSRNHGTRTPERAKKDDEQYYNYAKDQFENGYDYVIIGHTHRPKTITKGEKKYINLGDWIKHFTFAIINGEDLNLFQWNGNQTANSFNKIAAKKDEQELAETL